MKFENLTDFALLLIGGAVTVGLAGCFERPLTPTTKWQAGAFVRSALTNQHGQILSFSCIPDRKSCTYYVKFSRSEIKTNTHLFTSDEPLSISSTTTAWVAEFELIDG